MRWIERQRKVEEEVYECVDDIADELGLEVPYYPDVYWIGGKINPEISGLSPMEKEECRESAKEKRDEFLRKSEVILIVNENLSSMAEEAGHFLHHAISNTGHMESSSNLRITSCMLEEMWGFFCSKLVEPDRKNSFGKYIDFLPEEGFREGAKTLAALLLYEPQVNQEFLIYQQGYGLGEKLFNHYISGNFSMHKIRQMFSMHIDDDIDALATFLKMKYQLLK